MSQSLVQARPAPLASYAGGALTRDQIELLKRTVAKGTTDDEFSLFIATANRMALDPFAKQIFAVKRWDRRANREVMTIQVGIDGHRLAAMRTGELDGEEGPFWCGPDRVWVDVWIDDAPPEAAKFIVYRKGCSRPFTAVARYRSYVQTNQDGRPNPMWQRGDDFMLAKCAEALAKRKAFPAELSGVIAPEEAGGDGADDHPSDFQQLPSTSQPQLPAPRRAANDPLVVDPESDFARAARRDPTPTQGPGSAAGEVGDREAERRFVNGEPISNTEPDPKTTPDGPKTAPLTDDDVANLADQMKNAPDGKALSKIGVDIAKMTMNKAQRDYLARKYREADGALKGPKS